MSQRTTKGRRREPLVIEAFFAGGAILVVVGLGMLLDHPLTCIPRVRVRAEGADTEDMGDRVGVPARAGRDRAPACGRV